MDRIILNGMAFYGRHGELPAERELGQRFRVDVELTTDLGPAGVSDRLEDTVDYVVAYDIVRAVVEGKAHNLLESVAREIADRLTSLRGVDRATVRVHKRPPVPGEFEDVAIEVTRGGTLGAESGR
jgi:dihydroneopterin aldolase